MYAYIYLLVVFNFNTHSKLALLCWYMLTFPQNEHFPCQH